MHPLILLSAITACDDRSVPTPAEDPMPAEHGALSLDPARVPAGQPVTVSFDRPGSDACYRQSTVGTAVDVDARTATFSYATHREGEMCAQVLVPGGFSSSFVPKNAGSWTVRVVVDGAQTAQQTLEVTPP